MITVEKYQKQRFTPKQEKLTGTFNETFMYMLESYGFNDSQIEEVTEYIWNELDSEVVRVIRESV